MKEEDGFESVNKYVSSAPNGLLLKDTPRILARIHGPFAVVARCASCQNVNLFIVKDEEAECRPSMTPGDIIGVFEYIELDKCKQRCIKNQD